MQTRQNYGGLDAFRLVAAFLVIAIHTSPLTCFSANADFFLTRVLARVAVPFFFMVTGQFVVSRFYRDTNGRAALTKSLTKLSLLYLVAIALYVPIGLYGGHYEALSLGSALRLLLFDGTFYHLWYFPACLLGLCLVYLMSRKLSLRNSLAIALFLYLIGLMGDSYYGLARSIPVLDAFYQGGFQVFSYTRNGLFFAPIFLILGAWLSQRKTLERPKAIIGLCLSFAGMAGEAFILRHLGWPRHDSMYLFLLPTMLYLYHLVLSWQRPSCQRARTAATWVYILHPAVIVLIRAVAKALHLLPWLVDQSLAQFLAVSAVSFGAAYVLALILPRPQRYSPKGRAWIELDSQALAHNIAFLQSRLPRSCKLMPAVKANAYGHGAVPVCKELYRLGVRHFCVASLSEGIELRKNGIAGEILILGYTHPSQAFLLRRYRLSQTVVDSQYAKALSTYGKKLRVHIGIDTGMHRLGERSENIDQIALLFALKHLQIDGIFTHLSADESLSPRNKAFTKVQSMAFQSVLRELKKRGVPCPRTHLLASYGVLNYPELGGDYARIGIALYGILSTRADTDAWARQLRPVLSLKARVATVKPLYTQEAVGYGLSCTADHPMKIATLSIGYADGLPRSLSDGHGYVLLRGQKAPILGKICMDQTIIDVTDIPGVCAGDTAVLIGTSGTLTLSAGDLAESAGTISNEILSRLGARLDRILCC